jgi:hypothetical protein
MKQDRVGEDIEGNSPTLQRYRRQIILRVVFIKAPLMPFDFGHQQCRILFQACVGDFCGFKENSGPTLSWELVCGINEGSWSQTSNDESAASGRWVEALVNQTSPPLVVVGRWLPNPRLMEKGSEGETHSGPAGAFSRVHPIRWVGMSRRWLRTVN